MNLPLAIAGGVLGGALASVAIVWPIRAWRRRRALGRLALLVACGQGAVRLHEPDRDGWVSLFEVLAVARDWKIRVSVGDGLDQLARRDILERRFDPAHGCGAFYRLTGKGRTWIDRKFPIG